MSIYSNSQRTIRAPLNPLDKSTIVSIFPKRIEEVKPTIQPGRFIIEPGSYDKPALLTIGSSSWWKEMEPGQPLLEIPCSSIDIANSIVRDYCNGILGYNGEESMPGLFHVPGALTIDVIKKEYKHLLDAAVVKQRNWYSILVKRADIDWARSNGSPLTISPDMKLAAKELNLDADKEWTKDTQTMEKVRCKACGSLMNPLYPVCAVCKSVNDTVKAKALGLTFAQ